MTSFLMSVAGWARRNHVVLGMVILPYLTTALHNAPPALVPWILATLQAGIPLGLWSAWVAPPPGSPQSPSAPAGSPAAVAPALPAEGS